MDKSNSNELDTMGSMFSTANDNEPTNSENNETETFIEDSSLTSKNIEVNELEKLAETKNNVIDGVDSLSTQDIDLIIMEKSASSTNTTQIPEKFIDISSDIEDQEELWLEGDTRQLVKVSTDEDFEVIVKSLEKAIVETEEYDDIDTVTSAIVTQSESIIGMDDDKTDHCLEDTLALELNENDKLLQNLEPSEQFEDLSFNDDKLLPTDEELDLSSREIQILESTSVKDEDLTEIKTEDLNEKLIETTDEKVIIHEEKLISNECDDLLLKSEDFLLKNEDFLVYAKEEIEDTKLVEEEITENIEQEMINEVCEESLKQKEPEKPTREEIEDLSLNEDKLIENIIEKTDNLSKATEIVHENIELEEEINNEIKEELSENVEFETTTEVTPEKENFEAKHTNKESDELLVNTDVSKEELEDSIVVELQEAENLLQLNKESENFAEEVSNEQLLESAFDKNTDKQMEEQVKAMDFSEIVTDFLLETPTDSEKFPQIENVFSLEENDLTTSVKADVCTFELEEPLSKNVEKEEIDKDRDNEEVKETYLVESRAEKHLLNVEEEKESSPPKKIKLVREKLPMISQPQQIQKNIEISFQEEKKVEDKMEKCATEVEQEIVKIQEEKSPTVDSKNSNECKSPVKTQKLKLKRSYKQEDTKNKIVENVKKIISVEMKSDFPDTTKLEDTIIKEEKESLGINESKIKENLEILNIQHEYSSQENKTDIPSTIKLENVIINEEKETELEKEISTVSIKENETNIPDAAKLENAIIIENKGIESENESSAIDEYNTKVKLEFFNSQNEDSPVSIQENITVFPNTVKLENTICNEEKETDMKNEFLHTDEKLKLFNIQHENPTVFIQENKTDFPLENAVIEEKEMESTNEKLLTDECKTNESLEVFNIQHENSSVSIREDITDFPDTAHLENTIIIEEKETEPTNEFLCTDEYKTNENLEFLNVQNEIPPVSIQENKTVIPDTVNVENVIVNEEKETKIENESLLIDEYKTNENLEFLNVQEEPELPQEKINLFEVTKITEEQIIIPEKLETKSEEAIIDENAEKFNPPVISKIENVPSMAEKLEENIEPEEQFKENLLLIEAQFPLLSSRLQEPKVKKIYNADLNLSPVSLPKISQDTVSKKLQEHLVETTPIQKREISAQDHSANTESAIKIKINKRKIDLGESTSNLVTRPLSVVVDDLENTEQESIPKLVIKSFPREERSSPKITIKPIKPPEETYKKMKTPEEASHSPKITIKPIVKQDPLKITITKQKSDDTHSILKIYQPEDNQMQLMDHVPKITIKPIKPSGMSPKVTVKPIPSPNDSQMEIIHSPKVTIKPILRPELSPRQMKLKSMSFESTSGVTFEPICGTGQLLSDSENMSIKPITKTCEIVQSEDGTSNPLKLTIKPILKPEESSYQSPKITIKPIVKPDEADQQFVEESDKPERIILKIQKTNLPSPKERTSTHVKEMRKEPEIKIEAIPHDHNQKLDKIKLKLTKEGNHAQIIPTISLKRSLGMSDSTIEKRPRTEFPGTEILHTSDISINIVEPNMKPNPKTISEEVTIVKIDKSASGSKIPGQEQPISQSKFQEMLLKIQQKSDITCTANIQQEDSSSSDDVKIVEVIDPLKDPLRLHDEDVMIVNEINPFQNVQIINAEPIMQTPKKRGRPRKNPLEVKPEIKGEDCVEIRPKRTCRAPPGRTPFTVKERKPRGAGRGRGGSRGRGASKSPQKTPKDIKTPRAKALKEAKALAKIEAAKLSQEVIIDEITIEDSTNDTPGATPAGSPTKSEVKLSNTPLQMVEPAIKISQIKEELLKQPNPPPAVYEEETCMSADNSRAQTPARQVFIVPLSEGPEESQSSVQSSATTESSKTKKGRLEVCDVDSAVTVVDQIAEYSWGTGGPYMLQEQIAQFLGVKSFKRKYPGLTRRPVEMQERDFIREKGLVSESMCDMGLTAVPSTEVLDIMYTDFQEKYEEYRKFQRDKQSKEISNKQRAISLATTQEKSKIDFKERAVRSAASWNVNFNKARKESRRCCMDLQTFTINFPVGKTKVPQKNPVGHYPLALVPGQYTDYYKSYTSNELHYLPLNTVRYGPILPNQRCEPSQSDGSQSESDSSSGSDSDSSDESMSTEEEVPPTIVCKPATVQLAQMISTPKSKIH